MDTQKTYGVVGMGSALLDILVQVDESFLDKHNLPKGGMVLIDETQVSELAKEVESREHKVVAGGSSANAVYGASFLGTKSAFIGSVGEDAYAQTYVESENEKLDLFLSHVSMDTGRAFTFITSDGDRTFAVYLGATTQLAENHVSEHIIADTQIFHMEGYQLDTENGRVLFDFVAKCAKKHNTKISLDLADPGVVERHKDYLTQYVSENVDILFANEYEAKMFTGKEPQEAALELKDLVDIAIVKIGANGSIITNDHKIILVGAAEAEVIDTTGAGDMYAAGFFHCYLAGKELQVCGDTASDLAAQVVSQIGARLE